MEIGFLGLDGNPGSGNGYGSISQDGETTRHKLDRRYDEGCFKQEGFGFGLCGDAWRTPKVAKTEADFSPASTELLLENSGGCLLNKSTSAADKLSVSCNSKPENSALPYFQHMAGAHTKNAGYYYSGGMNTSTGMYLLSGVGGPFTASQWLELEQQALIYKYMKENEPVPLHLLFPIIKAFESAGWFGFNGGTFRPTSWGMGPFHLGYSNSTDPEPGRCRRTDGKKWRCSRDAVASQKYCERHMNRGRHRSRKHVEGQGNVNGHSVSGATKSSVTKLIPPSVAASSAEPLVLQGNCPSNNFDINQNRHHYQVKSLHSFTSNPNTNAFVDRMQVNGENCCNGLQDATQPTYLSPGIGVNCSESSFALTKQQISCEESAVPSQSLFDAVSWKTYGSSAYNPADFTSSSPSQTDEKTTVPPLRLPQELEMGLGVGSQKGKNQEQPIWTPTSYGPLGEALQSSTSINMLPKGWEYGTGSCQLSSLSPTGVLQKSALASLLNSSAGSSPRADHSKTIEHCRF